MSSPQDRTLAAEQRAVEQGHRAFVQPGGWVKVVSDSHDRKWYRVEFSAEQSSGLIIFRCRPDGLLAYADDHLDTRSTEPGALPCKHAALAARRLEREGLAEFSHEHPAGWRSTVKHEHDFETADRRCSCGEPEDPFDGLPGR